MPILNLSVLGPFEASLDGQPIYNFRSNKVQALLIFLAVERNRPHRREALMELLWPDMPLESAQINLRQTIYRLRQAIPQVSGKRDQSFVPLLLSDRQSVQLNPQGDIRVDLEEFRAWIERNPIRGVDLYRGDFLADFYLIDSNPFEQWAETLREKARLQILASLDQLTANSLQQGDFLQAQSFAWKQIEIDPLHELAYRQLMLALAQNQQHSAALSQYHILQRRLKEELAVSPSAETETLYQKIQAEAQRQVQADKLPKRAISAQQMPVFLLTDIENSTRLWDLHRQAMLSALLQHNAILEGQIRRHGGRILELRGDGVKAVFENVNPLQCVLDIQKAFGETDWGEIVNLRIRIGLHGVPTVRKGFDYFKEDDKYYGPVLNYTARIMDSGWGGQILVSEQIHDHFGLPPGASWQDFGKQALKSLDQPLRIFGLIHPDLPQQTFPPLRTLSTQEIAQEEKTQSLRHNLEPQPTPFVGRLEELAALNEMLGNPSVRLITLVGPGGMGKTRLAIATAESQLEQSKNGISARFSDGIFFIPLASLNAFGQVALAIAKAINLPLESVQSSESRERSAPTQTSESILEKLIGFLQNKETLIILDNFEHLLDGAEILAKILRGAPSVKVLVTSRERLHLREEQVFTIQGLQYPDWETTDDPCAYTAMELFLQSAHRVRSDFELAPREMVFLTRICQLVGGMPLGLELAASWVDFLSIEDIASEIQGSLDFLESDIRNMPDRHRSMRAVFDSSWWRLSKTEQKIFSRLSIFRGDFNREAAQKIGRAAIRDLAVLVNKSLVQFNPATNCYLIHELLRQFGAEKLGEDPVEELQTRNLHSTYYCEQIQNRFRYLVEGKSQLAFMGVESEFANIRTAWDWAIKNTVVENIDKAIDGICMYFNWNWRAKDAIEFCDSAVEALSRWIKLSPQEVENSAEISITRRVYAKALSWLGLFCLYFDHQKAADSLDQSMRIFDDLIKKGIDTRIDKTLVLFFQGQRDFLSGDLQSAKNRFQDSLSLSREIKYEWMIFNNLSNLGDVARTMGAPREAQIWFEQSLTQARRQQNHWDEISALNNLGWAARWLMAYDEAKELYEQSLELSRLYQNPLQEMHVLIALGFLALFLGRLEEALRRFRDCIAIPMELGIPQRGINCQTHIGVVQWLMGDLTAARIAFEKAIAITKPYDPTTQIFPITLYAEYLTINGAYREANDQLRIANGLVQDTFIDHFLAGRLARVQGWVALAQKNYPAARIHFEKSIELYQIINDDEQIAWSQAGLARAMIGLGDWEEAHQLLKEALWTSIEIQGFIPLVFSLPVIILLLSKKDPELARVVYAQIQHSPFPARIPLFADIIYTYLPDEIKNISNLVNSPPRQIELLPLLWETASTVLSSWIQVWMDESDLPVKIKAG